MANEKRLIDANWILGEIEHDIGCYEIGKLTEDDALYVELRDVVKMVCAAPTVDAVEVEDPELLKAIKLLIKQYGHSKASGYVHSPVAHALYYTWKQVDKGR